MRRSLPILVLGLVLGLVFAAWFAVRAVETWRFRSELELANTDFRARRFDAAQARLTRLAALRPRNGEVEYLLGACELVKRRTDAALAAWDRVPAQSPQGALAALSRGRLAFQISRYSLAEPSLLRASGADGAVGDEARRLLARLYWITGRRADYQKALRDDVERSADPSEILRTLWSLDHDAYPADGIAHALEKARQAAPDDDRVCLALADLATRTGRFDDADRLLIRCEQVRPADTAVWRARFEWAKAADRSDDLLKAAVHLPASSFSRAQVLAVRAWLAERAGDRAAQRSALTELVALQPADDDALERLADLAAQDGNVKQVAELRRRKAAGEAARDRYRTLINLPDLKAHAAELARAAEVIGRWFDAKAWWRLAARNDRSAKTEAEAALARLAKADPMSEPGPSLADLVGEVVDSSQPPRTIGPLNLVVPTFTDQADRSGLTFTFDNGRSELRQLPETMSGGVGLLDFDGDGFLDIYILQGGPFPPSGASPPFGDRLFRNRGDGRFEDATGSSGLAKLPGGYGHGIAVGDYDNDSRPDIFVTRWRSYALYHNLGRGQFEDVTVAAGLGGDRDWPTSAAWADLDNDGDLDLYVCHYVKWDAENPLLCEDPANPTGGLHYCDPRPLPSMPDHVFRNDGGRFVDVTESAGIVDQNGRGLGVIATDLDDDGRIDLFVANDTTANYFFRNRGGFRFVEQGLEAGLAASASGGNLAGMGIACGDFDGDGRIDLAVTNFLGESTTLYCNQGSGLFSDRSAVAGLAVATRPVLGFGLAALDANNDGRLDLAQANGHVSDMSPRIPYAMAAQLFLGNAAGKLVDVSRRAGAAWQVLRLGRGLAVGDLDNDGRIDVVLVSQNAPLAFLHNQPDANTSDRPRSPGHFLMLELEGTQSNRDGVGAVVTVTASGKVQVKPRFGGGSYLSASDHRLHFGLGDAQKVDRIEVAWPSGHHDRYEGLAADSGYHLREGAAAPAPLRGFGSPQKREVRSKTVPEVKTPEPNSAVSEMPEGEAYNGQTTRPARRTSSIWAAVGNPKSTRSSSSAAAADARVAASSIKPSSTTPVAASQP